MQTIKNLIKSRRTAIKLTADFDVFTKTPKGFIMGVLKMPLWMRLHLLFFNRMLVQIDNLEKYINQTKEKITNGQ